MNVAVLTGGGDCPGLNPAIRAITRRAVLEHGWTVTGVRDGWRGLLLSDVFPLDLAATSGILHVGGTILGTSRTNPFKQEGGPEKVLATMKELNLDALIAIGGEDTLGVANRLHGEFGLNVVGVPKTIDNDLSATDACIGFATAVDIATDAISRIHTTAASHSRIIVVEVMGRHAGWIGLMSGLAGGADAILIPEFPMSVEEVCRYIQRRVERGKRFSVIAVSEGVELVSEGGQEDMILRNQELDAFGHVQLGGVGNILAGEIERITGYETRATVLGHIQRGGSPSAQDRLLGSRLGVKAVDMVLDGQWGMMAAVRGSAIEAATLADAVRELKLVPKELYDMAHTFFG